MVMWKDAFEKINMELDLTKRKKQALDDLLSAGRISQPTHDCLSKDLDEEIYQIEVRRKGLAEKTASKISELEEQLQTLEFFLATTEMAYVAGEIGSELYSQESNALNLGLEATKQELNWIKEVIIQLVPKEPTPSISVTAAVESMEATPTVTAVENAPQVSSNAPIETPVEVTPTSSDKPIEQPSYVAVENATEPPMESTTTTTTTESPPQQEETKQG